MGYLKKGDIVEITSKNTTYTLKAKTGCRYVVDEVKENTVNVNCVLILDKKDIAKIGESKMTYEQSLRYKLLKDIKNSGFSGRKLSVAITGKPNHFHGYTGEARFNRDGDLSEKTYIRLGHDIEFAKRKLLGYEAKTIDENDVSIEEISIIDDPNIEEPVVEHRESKAPTFVIATIVIMLILLAYILNIHFGWF